MEPITTMVVAATAGVVVNLVTTALKRLVAKRKSELRIKLESGEVIKIDPEQSPEDLNAQILKALRESASAASKGSTNA